MLRENFNSSKLKFLEHDIPLMALTATAIVPVREDIVKSLKMSEDTAVVLTSFSGQILDLMSAILLNLCSVGFPFYVLARGCDKSRRRNLYCAMMYQTINLKFLYLTNH